MSAEASDYTATDRLDDLSRDQLALRAGSDHGVLIRYLEQCTRFDAHRIRLMLEMGTVEAQRRLAALPPAAAANGDTES